MWVGKQSCSRETFFEIEQHTGFGKDFTSLQFLVSQKRKVLSEPAMQPVTICPQREMAAIMLLQDKHRLWYIIYGRLQLHSTHAYIQTALYIMPVHAFDIHLLRSRLVVICIFLCLFSILLSSLQ